MPLFLDRDGVINKNARPHEYITRIGDFVFLPGTFESLQKLRDAGYDFYIITKQAAAARGLASYEDIAKTNAYMEQKLADAGVPLSGVYCCTHGYDDGCDCRKPKPGLFFQAAREHHIDLSRAVFLGDSEEDKKAGAAAGVRTIIIPQDAGVVAALPQLI